MNNKIYTAIPVNVGGNRRQQMISSKNMQYVRWTSVGVFDGHGTNEGLMINYLKLETIELSENGIIAKSLDMLDTIDEIKIRELIKNELGFDFSYSFKLTPQESAYYQTQTPTQQKQILENVMLATLGIEGRTPFGMPLKDDKGSLNLLTDEEFMEKVYQPYLNSL